ncbi:phenylacetate-CoA ligase [Thermosporothrix hazakensis]|uniref:Phenylacetate-CoA ligase n=2 Tax=Thermosporothrix TaxID=768650 RepID=A0A326U7G8_THEHA|nr:AMP-binding protein [Thermosporothrix hazakensis]PZW29472.1 phenylacetate-CoA ligase [Thermosporothrix hazakensis]BBH85757.1 phenylacetate-coenzyme A ligase [Thermosporothrix sp. COM3]GCE45813.1 phenylacetate-coenzyme A ligase [Thermosporothrix hazakensis]
MAYPEYWNPKTETLPREELQALQLHKLRRMCEWAYAKSPFHKRRFEAAGFHPDQLQRLDDIRRIPLMTREEWMEAQIDNPLFGDLLATDQTNAIRYHLTSGTSGRTPIRVLDSMKDWDWISEMWAYGFWAFGVRPTDTVYFAFGYGSFIGFWGAHYCCEKLGALVIPGGAQTTEARIKQIIEMGATTVCSTPTYALHMWQKAQELGIDIVKEGRVNKLILSGEPAGSIPAVKRQLEEAWGARVGDTAGMTEVGTIMIFECSHQPGGTHIIEDHFLEEVLHPQTGEPVGYGELGERVVTSFGRGFIPAIRYRSKDMVVRVPASTCTCGRTWDIYEGGIRGRWDDMKLIRGTNVYPRAVEAIIREYASIDEFQIYLWRKDNLQDEITIRLELKPGHEGEWEQLRQQLGKDLANAHEGLRFNLELMEYGTLPHFELKARRLIDARPVAQY